MTANFTTDELPLRPALLSHLLAPLRRPGLNPPPWARAALARLERPDAVVPLLASLAVRRPRTTDADPSLPPLVLAPWSPPSLAVELAQRATPQPAPVALTIHGEPVPTVTPTQSFRAQPPVSAPDSRTAPPPAMPAAAPVPSGAAVSSPASSLAVQAAPLGPNAGVDSPMGPSRPRRLLHRPSQPFLEPPPASASEPRSSGRRDTSPSAHSPASSPQAPSAPVQMDIPPASRSPASSPPVPAAADPPTNAIVVLAPPASEFGLPPLVVRATAAAPPAPSVAPARVKARPPVAPRGAEPLQPSPAPRVVAPAPIRPEPPTPRLPATLPSRPVAHGPLAATGVPATVAGSPRTAVLAPPSTPPSGANAPPRVPLDDAQIDALTERVQRTLQRRALLERGRR